MKKIVTNLTFWVGLAIIIGIVIGHFFPEIALKQVLSKPIKFNIWISEIDIKTSFSEMLGTGFISIIKFFINPIIFLTISLGIISMGNLKKVGKLGAKSLIYFEIVTTAALIIGIIVANVFKPGSGVMSTAASADITGLTKAPAAFSWLHFIRENVTLQFLFAAIIFGIIMSYSSRRQAVVDFLAPISKGIFKALHKVMLVAPIGAFGGMAYTIGRYGIHSLLPLGKLMITMYTTMACFIFVILYFILRHYKVSLWKFLTFIREELLIVLGTSSSEVALPSLMEKLEKMGCSKSVVGLVVPAGYSFNLDGTTIYLSMSIIFLAQVFNIHLDFGQIMSIIGILLLTSKGAAGVTGSGFIILASTLTAVRVIPMEGLALLLGVDRFMSDARAIVNFIGNGVATIFLANNEKEFDREKMDYAFEHVEEFEKIKE